MLGPRIERATIHFVVGFVIAIILFSGVVAGNNPTFVEESITTDTTWTSEDGPYRVTDDISISEGATLTIEPGTTVEFIDGTSLTVEGELIAGEEGEQRVEFISIENGDNSGTWGGLTIHGAAQLENVAIDNASTGLTVNEAGTVTATDALFRTTGSSAIRLGSGPPSGLTTGDEPSGGTASLHNATFREAGEGELESDVYFRGEGNLSISSSAISHGINAHYDEGEITHLNATNNIFNASVDFGNPAENDRYGAAGDIVFRDNRFNSGVYFSLGYGSLNGFVFNQNTLTSEATVSISASNAFSDVSFSENNMTGADISMSASGIRDVEIDSNTGVDTGITMSGQISVGDDITEVDIQNNNLTNSQLSLSTDSITEVEISENTLYGGNHGIEMTAESTIENSSIENNYIYWANSSGIYMHTSTPSTGEVIGVEISDNYVVENGGPGIEIDSPSANVCCNGNTESTISGNFIMNNSQGVELTKGVETTVSNNHIVDNEGTGITLAAEGQAVPSSTVFNIHGNNIYDNGDALSFTSDTSAEVVAENNYWGASSGPYYAGVLPEGEGGNVTSQGEAIDISPWNETRYDDLVPDDYETVVPESPPEISEEGSSTANATDEESTPDEITSNIRQNEAVTSSQGPGFTALGAVIALLCGVLLISQRKI